MVDLSTQAIQAALACDWQKAIKLNLELVKATPDDVQALNRLAYSHIQTDDPKKAKRIYSSILKIDPQNLMANKNLNKLKGNISTVKALPTNGQIYIDEPGMTRCVELVNTAPKVVLKKITPGIKAEYKIGKKKIEIRTESGEFIGSLPDDISFYMRRLSEKGNKYEMYIKEVVDSKVSVYIRELIRSFDTKKKVFNSLSSFSR
ncbi:hypothetical protein COW99_04850 [Candidatus Roizmanbacteria bacterium CG22_combo_CG10-13_8_21_14_all_38_20]|uniref:Uncharacterized protein n=1 Tax=Candidatus Roizmanbacteria bacterium CG22_combo_CG10-13_8_21_14_all_38_20 TaxID=1974862 RepID=A0A2H0BUF7_9BACT|nr:hypothetical protein [Candidatus Microgenomates bacterium]PIP61313.1 MAG: hypothetical protein COW99_04850 [Candidatus Roizmanbacteria bacterium CG22_combo_CG10-13_8_21_14_all_38_20]PJC30615.1 MAG: hypothetical protein CO050_05895 [Candidatus Roizmanbacteria bacterium CG_4_9_14_0_2_um_filter_38_17]